MSIGVHEIRDEFSRHLAHVRAGPTVTATDQGALARIVPIGVPSALERLITAGSGDPAKQPKRPVRRRVRTSGTAGGLVVEQRR